MNGAEALVRTLIAGGVDLCFTNPGTSEMHFVAALDANPDMRCVLGLQENVVTAAADGFARMTDKPAATLLHLGPGLSNGSANIHNAKKSRSAMVNVVGEHATYHKKFNAPLTSDIEGLARPVSHWVRTSTHADALSADAAEAVSAAGAYPGRIATLILPADTAWTETAAPIAATAARNAPGIPSDDHLKAAAEAVRSGEPTLVLLGGRALRQAPLDAASRIAETFDNVTVMAEMANARIERGAGRVAVNRLAYPVDIAVDMLKSFRHLILVEAVEPVAFFAYPDKPSRLLPEDCRIVNLAGIDSGGPAALDMLSEDLGAVAAVPNASGLNLPPLPTGALDNDAVGAIVANLIPENAIVVDEAITTGRAFFPVTAAARPHTWLQINGGAIGIGIPLAVGAALACPDRPVLSLQADGSAMYTLQGLWTQAREGQNVTTVIFSNRAYKILLGEMRNVGVADPGPKALDMLELDRPPLDWTALARGMGVEAGRAEDCEGLVREIERGLAGDGPYLVEAIL